MYKKIKDFAKGKLDKATWTKVRDVRKYVKIERKKDFPTPWTKILSNTAKSFNRDTPIVTKLDYGKGEVFMEAKSPAQLLRANACQKEPETVSWIERELGQNETFYDIGAHVGAYSFVAMIHSGGKCRVFAFEPEPHPFYTLTRNIRLNGWEDKITPLNIALGSKTCIDEFLSYRLDDFIEKFAIPPPDHLKIDVDGREWDILMGAENTIGNPKVKTVLIELDTKIVPENKFLKYFLDKGFKISSKNKRGGGEIFNCIFKR